MVKKGQIQKKYSSEFKIHVMMDMREHRFGYSETKRKYFPHLGERNFYFLKQWERVFLEEGAKLKVEMYYGEKFESPRGFIEKLEEYIHYYNNERISLKLKGMSPVEYRAHSQTI